jgi:hypothetical protein
MPGNMNVKYKDLLRSTTIFPTGCIKNKFTVVLNDLRCTRNIGFLKISFDIIGGLV